MQINKEDCKYHGIMMGDGFIDAIRKPFAMKEYIKQDSRLLDGTIIIVKNPKVASADMTLTFFVHGKKPEEYNNNLNWLYKQLYKGKVSIGIPHLNIELHLVYTGKSLTYAEDCSHCNGKVVVGFTEPNPTDRAFS